MQRFVLAIGVVFGLASVVPAQQLGLGQAMGGRSGQNPAAAVGLQLPTLGQQNQPRTQPTSAFGDLLQQPVTVDPFAARSDPRAAQAQGGTAGARTGFGGATGFGRTGIPGGVRTGGGFGRTGIGFGRGTGGNVASQRPSFVMRLAPVVAGLAPPPSISRVGGYVPRRRVPPVQASLQRIQGLRTVDVQVENGVAVLRGIAESVEARRLAELLVKMEPGVRSVRNEIEVVSATIAPPVQQ